MKEASTEMMDMDRVTCSDCGSELNDEKDSRSPCENCGSTKRTFHCSLTCTVTANAYLKMKHKEFDVNWKGKKHKAARETTIGDDYQRKSGLWMKIRMIVDRKNNCYKKTLTNPKTGVIVYHSEEPLSDHVNRGAGRKKES